jgi:hypothetical protein
MRLLYKPIAIIAGLISAKLGQSVFKSLWATIDDAPPPRADSREASVGKVIGAQALEGAVMKAVATGVDRVCANSFFHLFGIWPGKQAKQDSDSDRS